MPRTGRDAQTDSSRTGRDVPGREAFLYETDMGPHTLMDEKRRDKAMGLRGAGTRGAADIPVAEG